MLGKTKHHDCLDMGIPTKHEQALQVETGNFRVNSGGIDYIYFYPNFEL